MVEIVSTTPPGAWAGFPGATAWACRPNPRPGHRSDALYRSLGDDVVRVCV